MDCDASHEDDLFGWEVTAMAMGIAKEQEAAQLGLLGCGNDWIFGPEREF